MTNNELIIKAIGAMNRAYAPYSEFYVGAALLTEDGNVYTGCNIENASYSVTNCAERTAFFKAVEAGERRFEKIAIVGGKNGEIINYIPPCGVCLQVMSEFCSPDFEVILAKSVDDYSIKTLKELLSLSFSKNKMGE